MTVSGNRLCITVLVVLTAAAAGCSAPAWRRAVTEDARLRQVSEQTEPLPLKVAVAQVSLPQQLEPDSEESREHHPIACEPEQLLESVADSLAAFQVFEELRPLKLPGEDDEHSKLMEEAWERGYDAVLSMSFKELEVFYDGVNGWYLPNIINWLFLLVPSWWVKDEVYGARARFEISLRSSRSDRILYRSELTAEFKRSLNDFQRGWQLFGIFRVPASLGESNWRSISRHLLPGLLREIQVQTVLALANDFRKATLSPNFERLLETKLGVVVGISRHKDYSIPKLKYTEEDALSVYRFLTGPEGEGVPERNIRLLTNERASRNEILGALDYLAGKSRACDSIVLYFAGYGAVAAEADGGAAGAYLVPYDADRGDIAGTCLSLDELEQKIAKVKARELVIILDTGFNGDAGARGLEGGKEYRAPFQEILKSPGRFVLSSGQPGEGAVEVDDHRHGIFTFYMLEGLKGPADTDGNGAITLGELQEYLKAKVGEETEMEGSAQHPRLQGAGAAEVVIKGGH
jgi:hypothetical protein